jgi:hypothetical protein
MTASMLNIRPMATAIMAGSIGQVLGNWTQLYDCGVKVRIVNFQTYTP